MTEQLKKRPCLSLVVEASGKILFRKFRTIKC